MTEFIANGESGASVRAKLNGLASDVTTSFSALAAALKAGSSAALMIMADSTWDAAYEPGYRTAQIIAAQEPGVRVEYKLWNDDAQAYGVTDVIQAGSGGALGLRFNGVQGRVINNTDFSLANSDIHVAVQLSLDDWTPATEQNIAARYGGGGDRGWRLYLSTDGKLNFEVSPDGTALVRATSTNPVGFVDGSTQWVAGSLQLTNGSNAVISAWTSTDGIFWTLLGQVATTIMTTVYQSSVPYCLGARGITISPISGTVYEVDIGLGAIGASTTRLNYNPVTEWQVPTSFIATDNNTIIGGPVLYVVNAAKSGAGIPYMSNAVRLKKTLAPYARAMVVLATSHNEATQVGSEWRTAYTGLLTSIRGQLPYAPMALVRENPETSPASNVQAHRQRNAEISFLAKLYGHDVIDGWSPFFDANGVLIPGYLFTDGIHPINDGAEAYSQAAAGKFIRALLTYR